MYQAKSTLTKAEVNVTREDKNTWNKKEGEKGRENKRNKDKSGSSSAERGREGVLVHI